MLLDGEDVNHRQLSQEAADLAGMFRTIDTLLKPVERGTKCAERLGETK